MLGYSIGTYLIKSDATSHLCSQDNDSRKGITNSISCQEFNEFWCSFGIEFRNSMVLAKVPGEQISQDPRHGSQLGGGDGLAVHGTSGLAVYPLGDAGSTKRMLACGSLPQITVIYSFCDVFFHKTREQPQLDSSTEPGKGYEPVMGLPVPQSI